MVLLILFSALSAAPGTAEVTTDYMLPNSLTITFNPGDTSWTSMAIDINPDALVEDTEEFELSIALTSVATMNSGVILEPNPSTVLVFDRTCKYAVSCCCVI